MNKETNPKNDDIHSRVTLQNIARRVMLTRGLLPEFSTQAVSELAGIKGPAKVSVGQHFPPLLGSAQYPRACCRAQEESGADWTSLQNLRQRTRDGAAAPLRTTARRELTTRPLASSSARG